MMLDSLIVDSRQDKRVIRFSEFESRFGWRAHGEIMKPAVDIFRDFHPNMKPVLWRILLAQMCLYRALEQIRNDDTLKIDIYASFDEMCKAFNDMYDIDSSSKERDWKHCDLQGEEVYVGNVSDKYPVDAVKYYLNQKLEQIYARAEKERTFKTADKKQ